MNIEKYRVKYYIPYILQYNNVGTNDQEGYECSSIEKCRVKVGYPIYFTVQT